MKNIYIIDIETTGLKNDKTESVLEIGIARADLDLGRVYPEYSRIVRHCAPKDCWVFSNSSLTYEDCAESPYNTVTVRSELHLLYANKPFTSYNRSFDFGEWLNWPPWDFIPRWAPCLMKTYADVFNKGQWATAQKAYNTLYPDTNPAGLPDRTEEHRALSDAVMEGYILLGMCQHSERVKHTYEAYAEDDEIAR